MVLKKLFKRLFGALDKMKNWAEGEEPLYAETIDPDDRETHVYSLWDFLSFSDNTQAFHLINVIGFDEWVDMNEIRRRVLELFSIEYKNEKSLYPYLKTLTDINLFESTNIGGRRKWRKKDLLFEAAVDKEEEGQKIGEKNRIRIRPKNGKKE